ncbi:MAG TPA: 3-isopropylmalate dehydratase [Candidatus Wallbacteria bacterium]|nr:3-isopropylmalate dehydratase [Candidatus Wallbacteria bacterium]
MKERVLSGKVWILRDPDGNIYNNIDTDQIYHNNYLAITDIAQMGQYALGNLKGYEQFHKFVKKGDIIITGKNFGAGSSRQQAVDCFAALGVSLIICESIGAIYKRNAINSGFPIMTCPEIVKLAGEPGLKLKDGDVIRVDIESGAIKKNGEVSEIARGEAFSGVQKDIYDAGNIFSYVPPSN